MEKLSNKMNKIDDYVNILISIWMNSKKVIDETNKQNLKNNIKTLIKSIENIRIETDKKGFKKMSQKLSHFENELKTKDEFVNKLSQLSSLVALFDLPPEIECILKDLGLLDGSNAFNDLFDDIDLNEIQNLKEEGTLLDTLKEKKKPKETKEPLEKKINLERVREETNIPIFKEHQKIKEKSKIREHHKIKELPKNASKIKELPKNISKIKELPKIKTNFSELAEPIKKQNNLYSYVNCYGEKYNYYPNPHDF